MHSILGTEGHVPAAAVSPLLALARLSVTFTTASGPLAAVRNLTLDVAPGECLGIVGESGAGKSQAFLAMLGLSGGNARVSGSARFDGVELIGADERALNRVRGSRIGMIFQDPMASLTPHLRIGRQIAEPLVRHRAMSSQAARARSLALLHRVRISDPERRLEQYPHELSGGMRQRVAIAMALACDPALLIADEPTTALDVTVQAQVLALLAELKEELALAIVLVSHDFGVVAGLANRVGVMYAGAIVELGSAESVLRAPRHPYTRALLDSIPQLEGSGAQSLSPVRGQPPDPRHWPRGCAFHPRCERAADRCRREEPLCGGDAVSLAASVAACHFPLTAGAL